MKLFRPVVVLKRLLYTGLLHRRTVKGAMGFSSGANAKWSQSARQGGPHLSRPSAKFADFLMTVLRPKAAVLPQKETSVSSAPRTMWRRRQGGNR